ncbi:DUF2341 domain-containing protein [Humisphaera borealis]|uniref:DUF2341 domain-containing protein n=2 Tax=Humisphaera borealis TaxID=2807512 RepID=A0A7M2X3X5_9BACT|nr:DUF2341 domain-containing protein [Humisphaera borealis]
MLLAVLVLAGSSVAAAGYGDWKHTGSIFVLTTPEGANLPASASEKDFPILVRLHRDFFDFAQAQPNGQDIRFSTPGGDPLAYQIDEWDAKAGAASIWVRLPILKGNERQEIRVHWGRSDAKSESDGRAVFNDNNGFLSVLHMDEALADDAGSVQPKNGGTTATTGPIGAARTFAERQGIACGEKIANFPAGAAPHTSEAWIRARRSNGTIIAWGNEQAQGKVVMQFRSPPHIQMDCYFSGGNVSGASRVPTDEWVYVTHSYQQGESRVYVNGVLDGTNKSAGSPLNVRTPARFWIGGWYNNFSFVGDMDEVRISKVTRSADWVKLCYENQKPLQTLVGPVVRPGSSFGVTPAKIEVKEGSTATLTADAAGALKIYWSLKRDGTETPLAVDRFSLMFAPGRVTGDQNATIVCKAVFPSEVKNKEIDVLIKEAIPEPQFTLEAPATWDGREPIEIKANISNRDTLTATRSGPLTYRWAIAGIAATSSEIPGGLLLSRAHNSGKLSITATISNGGPAITQTIEIAVTEPVQDPWVYRTATKDEKPIDNQFYARDDRNEGTLFCNGGLAERPDSVFLRVTADDKPYQDLSQKLDAEGRYAFTVKLKPGLVKYAVKLGTKTGDDEKILHAATNLVCGDAYLIDGQSNAEATAWGKDEVNFTSTWIRTFGSMEGSPQGSRQIVWGDAVARGKGAKLQVGYWGLDLARRLVESQKMPICIINGAVGGTRIDQHQRNFADPEDVTTIYGRLLWRVRQAGLTHGIRGVLWHQGENDQGADGPTGGFGWQTYRQLFVEMAGAWKQDYPNIQHYYVFQIWPKSCAMGIDGSDNRLREVQRNLSTAFSRLSLMSTLGIDPPGGCHYPPEGYAEFARLILPLIERDHYGKVPTAPITPPNLRRAYAASGTTDRLVMEFDQPVKWDDSLKGQFYLDGVSGGIASGVCNGNVVTLQLSAPLAAKTLTYLDSKAWSQKTLLRGENGIAALTFCEVPIQTATSKSQK